VGNVTYDGTNYYLYDGEGRICAEQGVYTGASVGYIYDAEGNRVAKGSLSEFACGAWVAPGKSGNVFTLTESYVVGAGGEQLSVVGPTGNWLRSNAYVGGQALATYNPSGMYFNLTDAEGTKRVQTTYSGGIENQCWSLPFGDDLTCSGPDDNQLHYTAKERDTESGNDYFGARYYGSNGSRFLSPDPLGGHLENPQSLNKYAYALNNPLTNTDPTGLDSYLQCTQSNTNASTCQSQTVGHDKDGNAQTATVQGKTGKDGKFTATQIGNDKNGNLVDKTTGTGAYTASVNGSGVQFSNDGGQTSSTGVFDNGTPQTTFQDAGFANGGALSGFSFTLTNSKMEAGQTEAGSFSFNGNLSQARSAIQAAGFNYWPIGLDFGADEFRSPGNPGTGANSGHFILERSPNRSVPGGNMHFGEHNPMSDLPQHIHEAIQ
jgi:RHS repeat-associated protein